MPIDASSQLITFALDCLSLTAQTQRDVVGCSDCAQAETAEGAAIEAEPQDVPLDRRTPAQRRHDEILVAREKERVAKMASKSHRDRVRDFNEYLAALTEHHDIPKVGPG